MSSFIARLKAPSTTAKYWIHTSAGGYNSCIKINGGPSVLPNCVGYAWGRFMEILGSTPKLSRGDAENWFSYNDGYERGQVPRLGSVICWRKGKIHSSADGSGHVAIVEKIDIDGTITTSNSAFKGSRFYLRELKPPYKMSGYTLLGFIYNPSVSEEDVFDMTYISGRYEIIATNLRVRKKPIDGEIVDSVTVGDSVNVRGISMSSDNGSWGMIGDDKWICLETHDGKIYAKRTGDVDDSEKKARIKEMLAEIEKMIS